jgi:hypothetical protein
MVGAPAYQPAAAAGVPMGVSGASIFNGIMSNNAPETRTFLDLHDVDIRASSIVKATYGVT